MKLSVSEFANKVRSAKPEYEHLDDADILQMVTKKKPDLLGSIDHDDLVKVSNKSVAKQISKDRQRQFSSMSGFSRFSAGFGAGMADVYQGVKQLFGGDVEDYKQEKALYTEATKGSKTAAIGEILGGIAATAPIPGLTGAKLAGKVAAPLVKAAIGLGTAGAVGAGVGLGEFVDEGETRARNAAIGALFGAGAAGAGMLAKKVGAKAFNALKDRYASASIQEIVDLSKKYDIPLSAADVTGKGKNTERALEGVPLIGMAGFRKEGAEKVQSAIQKKAGEVMPDWDEALQKSLDGQSRLGKAQARVNYDKVEKLSTGLSIDPDNAIKAAQKHGDEIASSIMGNEVNPFTKIRDNLGKKGRTFSELRMDRSHLKKAAEKAAEAGDRDMARRLGEVKDGIEADIEKLVDKRVEVGTVGQEGKEKLIKPFKPELKEAFHTAQEHYKAKVVPYNKREIVNAIKSETPDELFNKFVKRGKGDRAENFYDLLDDKGKSAFRSGLLDNAITGATTEATGQVSPAKLAGYLERMSDPIESTLKGQDLEDIKGFAKIMRHSERYGQLNESPSNGMALIPWLKGAGLAAAGYGGATNPVATGAGIVGAGALTKLSSLMKTKGYKVALASDKIGSPKFEKALNALIAQLPKAAQITEKELEE